MTMLSEQSLMVGPWRVDPKNMCVWRGEEAAPLTLKAFAILRYLTAAQIGVAEICGR
jgi:DNA-binding response OmpR family regulator